MHRTSVNGELDNAIRLELNVTDRETVHELLKHEIDADREQFALAALRIGVLAVRQASGVVDAQSVQQECERFLDGIQDTLREHEKSVSQGVGTLLGRFFDPQSGEFQRRLDRLICKDGELETLLATHLHGEGSALSRMLERHVGDQSPLLQMLSPDQKRGLLAALTGSIGEVVQKQSEAILRQFSLDDRQSALSRCIAELTQKNGDLRTALTQDLEAVRKEFSLDNEDGALHRLVGQVDRANRTILLEFSADNEQSALRKLSRLLETTNSSIDSRLSLDDEKSPLSRLRSELLKVMQELNRQQTDFQEHVRTTLEALNVRKQEAARSTTHGLDFEAALGRFLTADAEGHGDLVDATGTRPGSIHNSKVGDFVITLSAESGAPEGRIVIEAKDKQVVRLKDAREEIQTARKNRDAAFGVFVFARNNAPTDLKPLTRFGQDVFVVWDPEDVTTDVYLKAALSIARALIVQREKAMNEQTVCYHEMEVAVNTVASDIEAIDEIVRCANLAKNNSEKVLKSAGPLKDKVIAQLDVLRAHVSGLQKTATTSVGGV
ncbi:MAG: hypothetical protein KF774_13020 [Planctomyces sp.]|nr:hypothetical protein [Planctomyces sp.]